MCVTRDRNTLERGLDRVEAESQESTARRKASHSGQYRAPYDPLHQWRNCELAGEALADFQDLHQEEGAEPEEDRRKGDFDQELLADDRHEPEGGRTRKE